MDFDDQHYDAALDGIAAVSGGDFSGLKSASPEVKSHFIKMRMGTIDSQRQGDVVVPENSRDFDPSARGESPRRKIGQNIKSALGSGSSLSPAQMEGFLLAQIAAGDFKDIGFIKLDGVLSEYETQALHVVADNYIAGESIGPQAFNGVSGKMEADQAQARAAAQQAAERQQQADLRTADIKSVQAGLKELGYYNGEMNGVSSPALADALYEYAVVNNDYLQNPDVASYAMEHYGTNNIRTQIAASLKGDDIGDSGLARDMVAAGLRRQSFDFNKALTSLDPAEISHAEAIAHALKPDADVKIDGTLDQPTVDAANAIIGDGAKVVSTNYSELRDMAQRGKLAAVADEHLSDIERQTMAAFGGADTAEGQMYLADLIREKGAQWHADGINKVELAKVEMKVQEITPRAMVLDPTREYSEETRLAVDIFEDTPKPGDLPADAPQDIRDLADAKQKYIDTQQLYGDPATGNFRAGSLDFDRGVAVAEFYSAEAKYGELEYEIMKDPKRLEGVQNYLADFKRGGPARSTPEAAPDATPDATPSTPATPEQTADEPAIARSTAKGDRLVATSGGDTPGMFERLLPEQANAAKVAGIVMPFDTARFGDTAPTPENNPVVQELQKRYGDMTASVPGL